MSMSDNPFDASFDDDVQFKEIMDYMTSGKGGSLQEKKHISVIKTKKTTLVFPASLMKRTKKFCVDNEISMTSFLVLLLEDFFKGNRKITDLQK